MEKNSTLPLLMGYWLYQAQFNNFVLLKDVVLKKWFNWS